MIATSRWFVALLGVALMALALPLRAQSPKDLFKQGNALHVQGKDCEAEKYYCQAAQADPNNQDYAKACGSLTGADSHWAGLAQTALDKKDFPGATRYAGLVCKYNPTQSAVAAGILKDAQAGGAPPPPPPAKKETPVAPTVDAGEALSRQAQTYFDQGNFDAALSSANQVPANSSYKGAANIIVGNINKYKGAIADAKQKEANNDLQGAIASYNNAQFMSANGPDDPAGNIRRLNDKLKAASVTAQVQAPGSVDGTVVNGSASKPAAGMQVHLVNKSLNVDLVQRTGPDGRYRFDDVKPGDGYSVLVYDPTSKLLGTDPRFSLGSGMRHTAIPNINIGGAVVATGATPPPDPQKAVADLLAEASKAGSLQDAMKDYNAVLRLQPGNPDATAGIARIKTELASDPKEQAKTLRLAIKDFYDAKYSEAEDELTTYLSSNKAQSRGAALFYLGATRLYRQVLEKPAQRVAATANPEVKRNFKAAFDAGYKPVEKYVSPLVMDAWKAAVSAP